MDKKLKILVIEDEDLLLQAIEKKLEREQIEGILCRNGNEAIEILQKEVVMPDAIWLDYYLPDMNGEDLLKKIQGNPVWKKIPVLLVSNSANTKKIELMLRLGAAKFILKAEYRLDEIVDMIRKIVGNPTQTA